MAAPDSTTRLGIVGARRPAPIGRRGVVIFGLVLAAVWAAWGLGLSPAGLWPKGNGLAILRDFASAALDPAFTYEGEVPAGTTPLPWKVLDAVRRTVIFAAAGMSLALVIGFVLGVLASTSWWRREGGGARGGGQLLRAIGGSSLFVLLRGTIALMRSVHELLWALLLLAALGLTPFSAVWAIAIPYGGSLAKIFSEMLDEAPRDSARALREAGASELSVFLFGLLPRAVPDMAAYAFYRFECAVRSSAVLGFFGFPTLGYFIRIAFQNQQYRVVWSYLWALIAVVVLLELWSSALRRRMVAC